MSQSEHHPKKRPLLYIPWLSNEEDDYFEEGEDSWVNYLRRNISHGLGEEIPFADSSWSYTDFDEPEKKSDESIREEVLDLLYQSEHIDASHIVVVVLNGVVCLMGTVQNEVEIRLVSKLMNEIEGVWRLRNELEVETQ